MAKDAYFFIEDANGLSWYFSGGILKKSNDRTPLKNNPDGWKDIEFSFETNFKYFGLGRSISTPFKFVREGADILRELAYTTQGNGMNTKAFLRILRKRPDKDAWVLDYYGQLDFTTFKDDIGVSVTINTLEGGLLQYLNANDNVSYDIVCSENSPQWVKVLYDGTTLADKYNYSIFNQSDLIINGFSNNQFRQAVGIVFLNNEGDSVGVVHGSPTPENITGNYYTDSANYLLYDSISSVSPKLEGTVKVNLRISSIPTNTPILFNNTTFNVYLKTATQSILLGSRTVTNADMTYSSINPFNINDWSAVVEFPVSLSITLAENEKLFIITETITAATYTPRYVLRYDLLESTLSISFTSKNVPTSSYALRPMWLFQALLDKFTGQPGKYIFKSNYFSTIIPNVVTTCGDALRNTDKTSTNSVIKEYYIATTFEEAFNAYSLVPMALKIQGNVLQVEPIADLYGGTDDIFTLGDISDVSIEPIKDRLINSLQIGYPNQDYDQRAGKYETNSEQTWKMPTDAVKNESNMVVRYRADCFGIEFIRSSYTGKDSTDSSGDKQPFLVMIDDTNSAPMLYMTIAAGTDTTTITMVDASYATRFAPGTVFNIRYSNNNDGYYKVLAANGAVLTAQWVGRGPKTITAETLVFVQVTFDNYTLYRERYTSISGVLDSTIYNVLLSPKHRLLNWGSYWSSIFYQQPTDQITLTTAKKNTQLSYTKRDGTTFIEAAPVKISDLAAPLFQPYLFNFKTPVAFTFLEVMANLGKGVVHALYEGRDLYLVPIGKMSMKPATNEAMDWQLYIHPRTSLMTILSLSNLGIVLNINNNSMYVSDLQPIHWVKYNYQKKNGIQQLQDWQEYEDARYPNYPSAERYYQKWQTSDTIKVFFPTNGIASLTLFVYNYKAELVNTYALNTLTVAGLFSPNLMKYVAIPASDLAPGLYQFVIQSGTQAVLISRHKVSAYNSHIDDGTMIIKYRHSYNRSDYYQELGELQLRVECQQGIPKALAEITGYVDDNRTTELLNGRIYESRTYVHGFPRGVPDWMAKKINLITTLDTISYEDVQVVRGSDAQLDYTPAPGYNLVYPTIELLTTHNNGVTIDEVTGDETSDDTIIISADLEGFGNDENIVQIIVNG